MHIAFLTLFLGLVSGRVPVELAVTGPTATIAGAPEAPAIAVVELVLDGAPAGRLLGPPWKEKIDLGRDLLPHHLEARGLDAKGALVDRAEQWINLTKPLAAVDITPELAADGRIAAARLSFRIETREAPNAVTARLDGASLPIQKERVVLPPYRPDQPHLLSVEARFHGSISARRDLAFGGGLDGEVTTELTAAVVRSRSPLPGPAALTDVFLVDGRPLKPSAVEKGSGEILAVRDAAAGRVLQKMLSASGFHPGPEFLLPIGKEDRLRLVDAGASVYRGNGSTSTVFDISAELDGSQQGLYSWLATTRALPSRATPRLADAVAVAGVQALADQRRRAVLLVLSEEQETPSRWAPAVVRRYLAAIRVPLYVWSLSAPPYAPAVAAWGEVADASNLDKLREAYDRLTRDLASQTIVWLDGRHLPQSISLSPRAAQAAPGLELVAGLER